MPRSATENLALLAFDDAKGSWHGYATRALQHAFAGTLLQQLVDVGAVELAEDGHVSATDTAPADDPLAVQSWESIRDDRKVRRLRDWVAKPTRLVHGLPGAVYHQLADRGVLVHDGTTKVFRRERYHEADARAEQDLVTTLGQVLDGEREPNGDELLLLGVLPPCRLTRDVFPDRDRRATERRIHELLAADHQARQVADDVARAVATEIAAIVAAAVAASVAASAD